MDLETAIYKMTGKASEMLGIRNRGFIKKGYAADIVVFDAETIIDTADYDDPIQYPKGIEYVLVNGKVMVENGKPKPQKAGKVLRYEGR